MTRPRQAWWSSIAVLASIAAGIASCSKSFEPGDETGGASGTAGTDVSGGVSGAAAGSGGRGGTGGVSKGGAGGTISRGGTEAAAGEAGASEPTGGTGNGGARGGTGGDQPTGGMGGEPSNGGTGGNPTTGGTGGSGGPTYHDVIVADEPLAYWRMGIASGSSIRNEMGGDNALVLQGSGHTLRKPGAIRDDPDTAIGFDGTASFAIASNAREFDFTDRAPFTLECWALRLTGGGGYFQHLFSNMVGTPGARDGYILYLLPEPAGTDAKRTSFEYDRPGVEVPLWGPVPDDGVWAHYAAVVDGATAKLYVNGTLESTQPIDAGFAARTGPFAVGRASNESRDFFKGSLDELAVYPRALSVGRIAEHFSYGVH